MDIPSHPHPEVGSMAASNHNAQQIVNSSNLHLGKPTSIPQRLQDGAILLSNAPALLGTPLHSIWQHQPRTPLPLFVALTLCNLKWSLPSIRQLAPKCCDTIFAFHFDKSFQMLPVLCDSFLEAMLQSHLDIFMSKQCQSNLQQPHTERRPETKKRCVDFFSQRVGGGSTESSPPGAEVFWGFGQRVSIVIGGG